MTKIVKQDQGAIKFKASGENLFILNWNDGIIEVWNNGKKELIIDMNKQ